MVDQRTPTICRTKAQECRDMATTIKNQEHRVMLQHMADTWERIAKDMEGHEKD